MLSVMALVTAVLPGMRRIRTPLFIGYCWIGTLWLVLRPLLPTRDNASGTVETLYEIASATKVGVLIAVTVAAYAIGSLTVLYLMWVLSWLPVPAAAKTIALDSSVEPTKSYVRNGVLPPELYRMDGFPSEFNRVCSEAQFRWSTPLPVMLAGIYLAISYSVWWIVPLALVPLLLMVDGYRCWVLACRMLSRAGVPVAANN
jgi:hypothetical protein